MTIGDTDYHLLLSALTLQQLIQDKIEQMQLVESAIEKTVSAIEREHQVDWSQMLELIHLTGMEKSFENPNIRMLITLLHESACIKEFSRNAQGWFPWIYQTVRYLSHKNVLELGCGNGALWTENRGPDSFREIHIVLLISRKGCCEMPGEISACRSPLFLPLF